MKLGSTRRLYAKRLGLLVCIALAGACAVNGAAATEPIYLSGFELGAEGYPVVGTGTVSDPFVLRDLLIDAEGGAYGIWIEDSDAHLVIERCMITGCTSPTALGAIYLRHCSNVTIRDCLIYENRVGIRLDRSEGITVVDNRIIDNFYGIRLEFFSQGNLIYGNRFENEQNAYANRQNEWSFEGIGNCWSDVVSGKIYEISRGNVDLFAHCLMECPPPVDRQPPTIPDRPILLECGLATSESIPCLFAYDRVDGNIPVVLQISDVDFDTVGVYSINASACDRAGNCANSVVEIWVQDTTPATVELLGPNPLTIACNVLVEDIDPGITVYDSCCGILEPTVDYSQVDSSKPGRYIITYGAQDAYGNVSRSTRSVLVEDRVPPELVLLGGNPMTIGCNDVWQDVDPWIRVSDNCDPTPITGSLVKEAEREGVAFVVTYWAEDSSGNRCEITRDVVRLDTAPPTVTIDSQGDLILECGSTFDQLASGVTIEDVCDPNPRLEVDDSAVQYDTPGEYEIVYTGVDSSGNRSVVKRRVIVKDSIPPVLKLLGTDPLLVERCADLVAADPGVQVEDVQSPVQVDTRYPDSESGPLPCGEYTIEYVATDPSGNTATVSRTVLVQDTVAPSLRLEGSETVYLSEDFSREDLLQGLQVLDTPCQCPMPSEVIDVEFSRDALLRDGTTLATYTAVDEANNKSMPISRTLVLAPPPPVLGNSGGLDTEVVYYGFVEGTYVIDLSVQGNLSKYVTLLQVTELVRTTEVLVNDPELMLHVSIESEQLGTTTFRFPVRLLQEQAEGSSDLCAFLGQLLKRNDGISSTLVSSHRSYQAEEASSWSRAVLQFAVTQSNQYLVRAYAPDPSQPGSLRVEALAYISENSSPEDLDRIAADAYRAGALIRIVLGESHEIEIGIFGDHHGLLYMGRFVPNRETGTNWRVDYVNPLFHSSD